MTTTTPTTSPRKGAPGGGDATAPPPVAPNASAGAIARRRSRLGRWLIAPALGFMVLVHLIPTAAGFYLSFKNINAFTFAQLFGAPWTGLRNYELILFTEANPIHSGFLDAARNTAIYTALTVAGTLGGGLGLALLMHRQFPGRRIARTLLLTPWIIPSFVVAILWQFMWQSDVGLVNRILVDWTGVVGDRPVWLLGDNALWAIVIPSIWRGIPLAMLIFLAGLQAVPDELHEAAAIDGAGPIRRFREITLPLLRPLFAVQLLFGVIYSSYQFVIPFVMLGDNPGTSADLIMTLVVRESFSNSLIGIGAAVSTLMMLAMAVWVAMWFRTFRRDLEPA